MSRLRRQTAEPRIGLTQDRHILVLTFVESLCAVECDRETWLQTPPSDEESARVESRIDEFRDRRREGFLRSATDLRRLLDPEAGGGLTALRIVDGGWRWMNWQAVRRRRGSSRRRLWGPQRARAHSWPG